MISDIALKDIRYTFYALFPLPFHLNDFINFLINFNDNKFIEIKNVEVVVLLYLCVRYST